jgi:hypothetical protein
VDSSGSGYGLETGSCEKVHESSGFTKGGSFWISKVTVSFSRRTLLPGVS